MPEITKPNTIKTLQKTIVEKVVTKAKDGEININLNLVIKVESNGIGISAGVEQKQSQEPINTLKIKSDEDFVPEEQFDLEIPVLKNFGK